jgi:hypothetical protein
MKQILLTAAAAARLIGVNRVTISYYVRMGYLTPAQEGIWDFGPLRLVVPTLFKAEDVINCKKERENR